MKFKSLGYALIFLILPPFVHAQGQKAQCQIDWARGQQLAKNHLWDAFEVKTKMLIKKCGEELSYGTLYADLAEAQGYQGKYKDSLVSAEKCLAIEMQPECHLRKVLALSALGKGGVYAAKNDAEISCKMVTKGSVEDIGCQRILLEIKGIPN